MNSESRAKNSCLIVASRLDLGVIFLILGIGIGALGTLIGVGGGFLLVPIFLYLYPDLTAADVTAASLFCITVNAASGSVQYGLRGLVHFRSALFFGLVSIPGALLGVRLAHGIERSKFEIIYAILLIILAVVLFSQKKRSERGGDKTIKLNDKQYGIGAFVSFFVGIVASFFGVGGGIIHVPFLSGVLNFPVHMATGTSQFILMITSLSATLQHFIKGTLQVSQSFVIYSAIGMVLGAQLGARYATRVRGDIILNLLASVILFIALRILYRFYVN